MQWLKTLVEFVSVAPVIVGVLLAGVLWVAAFGLAGGLPLAYLLIGAVVWIGSNYAFEVVEHRAEGADGWPVLSIETMVAARNQLGSLFAVCGGSVLLLYVYFVATGRRDLATITTVCGIVVAPAVIALLGVSRSRRARVDPRKLAIAALGLGFDYLVAVAITAGCVWVGALAYWSRRFPELFAAVYSAFTLAYFLGSAAYGRRLKLGVHAPRAPEARAEAHYRRLVTRRRQALDHAYGIAAGGGGLGKALAHLEDYVGTEHDPLDARLWLFHEMVRWEDVRPAIELGKALAADLNDAERREDAAKVLVGCRYLDERSKAHSHRR